jgi:ssDNA-binding Zn-finger/Zn-ribbon topoisomerase 1
MKNIHILPTDKPSRLHSWTDEKGTRLELCDLEYSHTRNTQHIYITSDEEIKSKDWIISKSTGELIKSSKSYCANNEYGKKIILTTDQDLIKDGVQAIDDEFLEWFVKNPSCEEVEFKSEYLGSKCLKCGFIENHDEVDTEDCPKCHNTTYDHLYNQYKIIIPTEEPKTNLEKLPFPELIKEFAEYYKNIPLIEEPKQETLEEAAERFVNTTRLKNPKSLFCEGAKWQQERMYSDEKIICAAIWYKEIPLKKTIPDVLPKNCDRGLVISGHRHGQCMWVMGSLTGLRSVMNAPDGVGDYVQGFLTSKNRFVDREEAAQIWLKESPNNKLNYSSTELYSEDIY